MYNRDVFFASVRTSLFGGALDQQQVDGMSALLDVWERDYEQDYPDTRWLAYALATTLHESASTMWPIEEYQGAQQSYGGVDPETGQRYFGRGFCQTTHRENYARADKELGLTGDMRCEMNAELQLDPEIAAATMYQGMIFGWFRQKDGKPETLERHFNSTVDDPVGARNIINGDQTKVPSWSNGVPIGQLIANYHREFLQALEDAWEDEDLAFSEPDPLVIKVVITAPPGVRVEVDLQESL